MIGKSNKFHAIADMVDIAELVGVMLGRLERSDMIVNVVDATRLIVIMIGIVEEFHGDCRHGRCCQPVMAMIAKEVGEFDVLNSMIRLHDLRNQIIRHVC